MQAYYESGSSTPTWKVLNDGGETEVVTITASSDVSQTLANKTIYYIRSQGISGPGVLSFTVDSSMSYCTVCFTAGDNTVFTHITGSRCIGYDCSNGIFAPVSGKEYQIAIDKLNSQLTLYVLRLN